MSRTANSTTRVLLAGLRRGTVRSFLGALVRRETYSPRANLYFVFGFLWGIPVPLVALGVHVAAIGAPATLASVLDCLFTYPIHWFFMLHPFLFAVVFGATGTVVADRERQIEALVERLRAQADTDALTGLYNHRAFQELIRSESTAEDRTARTISLLLLDLDFFKAFNDSHGHPAGDDLLHAFARRVRSVVRPDDKTCRYGGDEFAVVMPAADEEAAARIAERVRAHVAGDPFVLPSGLSVRITLSGGVAAHRPGESVPEWIRRADWRLYLAKESGRNRVCCADVEPAKGAAVQPPRT
ncbi:MAG: GGDEF domain-containing protein [Planctomycetes bacterium]|nr:GGDEF domain-containing protein [Planctomycetota bacterium]